MRASVACPGRDAQANVVGTVNVLEAARAVGARVLFCSTGGALYGRDAPIPSLEDVLPLPESPYGVAKHCAEQYVGLYNRLHGTGTRRAAVRQRLRPAAGPDRRGRGRRRSSAPGCWPGSGPTIYGDGTQTRDYVYVGDAVAAFLAAADRGRPGTWNIGTGTEVSVLEPGPRHRRGGGPPSRAGVRPGPARRAAAQRPGGRAGASATWAGRASDPAGRRRARGVPVDRGRAPDRALLIQVRLAMPGPLRLAGACPDPTGAARISCAR